MGFFSGSDAVKPLPSVLETDREATISHRGVEYHIAFDLSQITPRLRKGLKKISEGDKANTEDVLVEYISVVLTGWDIPDKGGKDIPLTVEGVSSVSYDILNQIADAINGTVPNATGEAASPHLTGAAAVSPS